MKIYFVRHGESAANVHQPEDIVSQAAEDRLTKTGHRQAQALGNRLKNEKLTRIITSPYQRTQETAPGINDILGLPLEINDLIYELKESDQFYALAGRARGRYGWVQWMPTLLPDQAPAGGESFSHITARVRTFGTLRRRKPSSCHLLALSALLC